MRRFAALALASLAFAPAAHAACPVTVSSARGAAPLRVSFHATCASSFYRWDFGDRRAAEGATVAHRFGAGRFKPKLTTDSGVQRLAPVTSVALTLAAPRRARYGETVTFRARVVPKLPVRLAGRPVRNGRIAVAITRPSWTAIAGGVTARTTILVEPRVDVRLTGPPVLGSYIRVVAILRPAHAGRVKVKVDGLPTNLVDTSRIHRARIVVSSTPRTSWARASAVVHTEIVSPNVGPGSRGPTVVALERRLQQLGYALRYVDGVFGSDDGEAVLAFQKVHGLVRSGRVTADFWHRLARSGVPRARYAGDHVEVDKRRQVLFLVRDGKVVLTTHISTGATGNTPLGKWHVYRKVNGWSWVLWYPSYFLRGFAIHGYPSVPAYPASHGCVRVPMWLAPQLSAKIPYGSAIYVY